MSDEVLAMVALSGSGVLLLLVSGVRDRLLLAWAPVVVGTGVLTFLLLLAALVRLPQNQWHLMLLALLAAGIALAIGLVRRNSLRRAPLIWAAGVVAAHAAIAAALHGTRYVRVTVDSFEYVGAGSVIVRTGDYLELPLIWLLKRGLTLPAVHGLATESRYLSSFGPVVAIAALLALVWATRELLRGQVAPWMLAALSTGGILFVVTINRFVYNALYLNGHLLFGLCALTLVAVPLVRLRTGRPGPWPTILLLAATVAALVPLRPEAFIVAAAFLLPCLCAPAWSLLERRLTLTAYAGATLLNGVVLAVAHLAGGEPLPVEALLQVGTAALAAGVAWGLPWVPTRLLTVAPALATLFLYLVVAGAALREPTMFAASIDSIHHNAVLGEGLWGSSLVVLGGALLAVTLLRRWPEQWPLLLPILSFIAISLVLSLGPRGAYRVGPGDSLNRMWLHVLLIGVLTLLTSARSRPHSLPWRRAADHTREDEPEAVPAVPQGR